MQPPTMAPATTPVQPQPVVVQPMAQPVVRRALRALDHIASVDENIEEVILREVQNGSETLSLIVGEKLFQVIRTRQSNSIVTCEHEFTMKRNSIEGFTHQRFRVLKKFRIPIIAITGITSTLYGFNRFVANPIVVPIKKKRFLELVPRSTVSDKWF